MSKLFNNDLIRLNMVKDYFDILTFHSILVGTYQSLTNVPGINNEPLKLHVVTIST